MRHTRYNYWSGNHSGHSRAARLGWRRGKRRVRRNAGTSVTGIAKRTYSTVRGAAGKAFSGKLAMDGLELIGGGVASQYVAKLLEAHVPYYGHFVAKSKWLDVLNVFVATGITATVASKIPGLKKSTRNVLLGGVVSGLNRGLTELFPGTFRGLGEEMDGLGWDVAGMGDYIHPRQIAHAVPTMQPYPGAHAMAHHPAMHPHMQGLGNFADPRQIMHAIQADNRPFPGQHMGDYGNVRQSHHAAVTPWLKLDGLGGMDAVAEMIEQDA